MRILNFIKSKKDDYYSQSGQDQFAHNLSGFGGFYLEIGAHHPLINSNTYNLEVKCNWKGISVEYDKSFQSHWKNQVERKNLIIWDDAFNINYEKLSKDNLIPKRINYLSCDIEPPQKTFDILKKIINAGIDFDFISFEHDKYNEGTKYEVLSSNYLLNNNYKIAVKDVFSRGKKRKIYETWFVHNDIDFEIMDYLNWKMSFYKKSIFQLSDIR